MATAQKVKDSIRPRAETGSWMSIGSGGRIRTTDQGLMSPLLYH
jgi:hypothetical protein